MKILSELSKMERLILKLIPDQRVYYPEFYNFYKSTNGRIGDRMLRNYMEKFQKLRLINMERKGIGGSCFITLNTPKDVLSEISWQLEFHERCGEVLGEKDAYFFNALYAGFIAANTPIIAYQY